MSKKSIFFIFILFIIYFIFSSISYSKSISTELQNNLFRLHIIANSDSEEDQALKLYIRDNLVKYLEQYTFKNKEEMISFLNNNKSEIEQQIKSYIEEKGFSYTFSIEIGRSFFPKKEYGNIIVPSGLYDGIKIKIGKAEGKNWWCILFPPMCLIDSSTCEITESSETILENSLNDETFSILFSETPEYNFKFKIVDFFNNLWISKNRTKV